MAQIKKKSVISIRVSSKPQEAKLQLKDCLEFCRKKDFEVIKIFEEVASAGKSKQKQIYEAEQLAIKEKAHLVVWKYDRMFRNKKDFVSFMLKFYELHKLKVYSVREEWVNMLWELNETIDFSKIPEPYDEMMRDQFFLQWKNMIRIIGKMAEDEIKDKGARVRMAVKKKNGITKSYKGKKWGRPLKITNKLKQEVLKLNKNGMSIREVSQSVWFWDKNNNQKFISKSAVHKILVEDRTNPQHKPLSN